MSSSLILVRTDQKVVTKHQLLFDDRFNHTLQLTVVNAALDDNRLAIDDDVHRQVEDAQAHGQVAIQAAWFMDMIPRIIVLLEESFGIFWVAIDINTDDAQFIFSELAAQFFKSAHLLFAWLTPTGPVMDDYRAANQIL